MRLGIYKDTLANSRGADKAVIALAEGLRERGHDAVLFEKADFAARIKEPWDVVISTGTNELLGLHHHFPLPHSPTHPLTHFPFPVIQQFHTNPQSQFKWKRIIRNWRIRQALRHVSAIQVLNERFVPQVEKYGVPVHVIGNWSGLSYELGVESLELPTHNSKLMTPPLTHSSTPTSTIIYPAAFAKGKNQKLLIEAFARISAEFPDWKLRLLGRADGGYADECRRLAAKSGFADRIEFAGFCDDLAEEYQTCAFVAFPSVDEGFGLVIADAAAFAKPCVTVRDWIGAASADGGIVTKSTVAAYAEGLRQLMVAPELRRQTGEAARKFVLERYSRERILDKWESLLKESVGK